MLKLVRVLDRYLDRYLEIKAETDISQVFLVFMLWRLATVAGV